MVGRSLNRSRVSATIRQESESDVSRTFKGYVPIEAPEFELEDPAGTRKLTVKCVGMLPGTRFLDFLASTGSNNPQELGDAVYGLFKAAIRPEMYESFKSFVDEPANGISIDLLAEIAGHLGELYTKRPTAPSSASSAG